MPTLTHSSSMLLRIVDWLVYRPRLNFIIKLIHLFLYNSECTTRSRYHRFDLIGEAIQ